MDVFPRAVVAGHSASNDALCPATTAPLRLRSWVPGPPHPISGLPEIGIMDAHIGYSRCALAPRND
jgi:hypothetical protein